MQKDTLSSFQEGRCSVQRAILCSMQWDTRSIMHKNTLCGMLHGAQDIPLHTTKGMHLHTTKGMHLHTA
jgi:hypothetical protein